MNQANIRNTTTKYTRKDGTVVEKTYQRAYIPVDKTNKITQKKITDKIKEAKPEQYKDIYEAVVQIIDKPKDGTEKDN